MKSIATLGLSLLLLAPLQAQVFHPQTIGGAILGGVAGAVIGNNSGDLDHNAWRGAAIGTAAGALLGSATGEWRERSVYRGTQVPTPTRYYSSSPYRHYGYANGYGYSQPVYGGSGFRRTSRATSGLLLGGLAGAVIGNNSGDLRHNSWRGAAIGAGSGWLLGAIADRNARAREAQADVVRDAAAAAAVQAAAQQSAPQNVTIINNYYGSPAGAMGSANGMFGR